METQKKSNNILLIILVILVVGLGGFILYDRVLNNNEKCDNQDVVTNKEVNYNEKFMKKYFKYYMNYIPWQYDDNSRLQNVSVNDVTDKISIIVWRYIWENTDNKQMTISEVNNFLYEYFNLSNYDVEELVKEDEPTPGKPWNIFGLTKEDGYYKATMVATEFSFPTYEVKSVTYNAENVIINFNTSPSYPGDDNIQSGTLTLKNNNGNLNFEKIEFNNL